MVTVAVLRDAIHLAPNFTADQREALLGLLPSEVYRLERVGPDMWRVAAPGHRSVVFRCGLVGLHYLHLLAGRGSAGERVDTLYPDSANPRQAVDRSCRCAIEQIRQHCTPLADVLDRALTVGKIARLRLPPHAAIESGNDLATESAPLPG